MKKNKFIIAIILIFVTTLLQSQIIKVNGIREFKIDNTTIVTKDGVITETKPIDIIGSGGFKINFSLTTSTANQTISQGTLAEINIISDIKGPVTTLNPLTILDIDVFSTADTVLDEITSIDNLIIGDMVSVSGAINEVDNSIQLSRLELKDSLNEWKVRGFARNITATSFTIGDLLINLNGVLPGDCLNGFTDNTFVEIKATVDATYSSGNTLTTLTSIECQTPDIDNGDVGTIPTVIEGVISDILDLSSFKINDLLIFFDANTSFDNGEFEHLDVGTKVEVQGFIDTSTRIIAAKTIRFSNHRVKFIAPVKPEDIIPNQSITMFGQLIHFTPQTRDQDAIVTNGITVESQIEVRGFLDSQGNIYAQRIRSRGNSDSNDTKLRGDITSLNKPFVIVNGINIDATSSVFQLSDTILDIDTFFQQLQVGMQLTIEEAIYDRATQTLSFGQIELTEQELEDDADDDTNKKSLSFTKKDIIGSGGVGIATITGSEVIFGNGFD